MTKKIPRQDYTIQTKLDIPKQQKKILPANRGKMGEDIPDTGYKRGKHILE